MPVGARAISSLPLEAQWRASLEQKLQRRVGRALEVKVTDNVHTMLSFSRRQGVLVVRLHHMFLVAPEPIVEALGRYIVSGESLASSTLDEYIQGNRRLIRRVPPHVRRQRVPIRPRGRIHDLEEIFDDLDLRWFDGRTDCAITWGPAPRARLPRKSIKLGSYSADSRLIRIHPAMDQTVVPRYFVAWIVFHEMLHHRFGIWLRGGRRFVHPPAFCEAERAYPDYERARAWERENLDLLLSWSTRSGSWPEEGGYSASASMSWGAVSSP